MPKHLKHLEHSGGEVFSPETLLNRRTAKDREIKLDLFEKQKELTLAEKQAKYLSPTNDELFEDMM